MDDWLPEYTTVKTSVSIEPMMCHVSKPLTFATPRTAEFSTPSNCGPGGRGGQVQAQEPVHAKQPGAVAEHGAQLGGQVGGGGHGANIIKHSD